VECSLSNLLTAIRFRNYKRLRNFSVRAQKGNIFVGPNNSGKSSILDGFRLLEASLRYSQRRRPEILDLPNGVFDGYEIPESACPFHLANVVTNYGDDDAVIEFDHKNGSTAYIHWANDRLIRFYIDAGGKRLTTSKQFNDAFPIDLIVVPTLAPLESEEQLVRPETVRRNRNTRLAARNFRNIWHLEESQLFEVFRERVERAWSGIRLQPPELILETPPRVEMYFEENRVTREIQWAGFGFQVWLQIHTHLIRGNTNSILILDEPDIYLHPDLQHRLYNDIQEFFGQYFIATHAIEIINVADTAEILVVEPESKSAKRIRKDTDYDAMLNYIGSADNADFAKIAKVKKVLFVEGNDAKILRRFARRLGLEFLTIEQKSPIFQLGGFTQWRRAENTAWAFKNLLDVEINIICMFDRDYRSTEEIQEFKDNMENVGLKCIFLKSKEIENYLICPTAIARAINLKLSMSGKNISEITSDSVSEIITQIANDFKDWTSAQYTSNVIRYKQEKKSKEDNSTLISKSFSEFNSDWSDFNQMCALLPGKDFLRKLFEFIKAEYGVSISIAQIQDNMHLDEINPEMKNIIFEIENFFKR